VTDPANAQSIEKKYTKGDLLKKLYYQGSQTAFKRASTTNPKAFFCRVSLFGFG
jgi:hypothetical protein